MEYSDSALYKLRFLGIGLFIIAVLVLLLMLFTGIGTSNVEASRMQPSPDDPMSSLAGSPNVVADGFAHVTGSISSSLESFNRGLGVIGSNFDKSTSQLAQSITSGTLSALRNTGSGLSAAGMAAGNTIVFVLRIPENTLGYIGDTRLVSAVIRPTATDNEVVPIIDPNSPELFKAKIALTAADSQAPADTTSAWPIHGAITTEFGASDWPYQAVHTGIDISDGQRPGITPIHAFRAGRVIDVVYSSLGLGNHVVVDHGSGVTSVYAHLSSIAVQVGQAVDKSTTLGLEGTTGASTGTHLHFEIRVNGQAADPHNFIVGQP